jgi:ribonuclease E
MLDSERDSHETDTDQAAGRSAGSAPAPVTPAVPAALFQAPQVLFQPPVAVGPAAGDRDAGDRDARERETAERPPIDREASDRDAGDRERGAADSGRATTRRTRGTRTQEARTQEAPRGQEARGQESRGQESPRPVDGTDEAAPAADAEASRATRRTRGRSRGRVREAAQEDDLFSAEAAGAVDEADAAAPAGSTAVGDDGEETVGSRRRRRRNGRTPRRSGEAATADDDFDGQGADDGLTGDADEGDNGDQGDADGSESGIAGRRRRRKRRRGAADGDVLSPDDPPDTVVHVREAHNPLDDVRAIKGSTRLEAKKQRRREGRESGRRRPPVITESEFLARRESVDRTMIVRQRGDRTQIAVLEDGVLVEHYVNRTTHASYVGNVYLGKVQNVLPSMEAAFVDIGKGRNAVLYAGEVNFDASGLEGQPKRIESALKPGQSVIVQVTKDPVGHKGARLTSQVSLPGRYLVYVPGASMTGISRKLPETERTRLKQILKKVTPEHAGVIVRTAAEGAAEVELDRDITRLAAQWESIEKKAKTASAPALLYGEPDLTIRVVRDVFNEDFNSLIVSGDEGWEIIDEYVRYVAPHLAERITRWEHDDDPDTDVFADYRIDEQLAKALERKVWLPSGGSLVIDRTEAMTVVDVNTGKFTGQGGNLEETVTRNNLEAAEEIVRQLRLRDVGGIVVIDFIDMVLEANRELVLRRLLECLARDRTKHQVAEVTSLGLVQMTRKRVGAGLLEAFSQQCECCSGRGVIITLDAPAEQVHRPSPGTAHRPVPVAPSGSAVSSHSAGQANGAGNGNGGNGGNGRSNGNGNGGNGRNRDAGRQSANARGAGQDVLAEAEFTEGRPVEAALEISRPGGGAGDATATATANGATANGAAANGIQDNGTGQANGGSRSNGAGRTRRSTSAGTAFATAVRVEDTPALVPVVTTVQAVPEAAPSGVSLAAPGVTSDGAPAATADVDAPPVRRTRTRSGSAVARVTVTADPEQATPDQEAPANEPVPAAATPPVDAAPATEPADAQAPAADGEPLATPPTSPEASAPPEAPTSPEASAPPEAPTSPEASAPAESALIVEAQSPLDEPLVVDALTAPEVLIPAEPVAAAPVVDAFRTPEFLTPAEPATAEPIDGPVLAEPEINSEAAGEPQPEAAPEAPAPADGETPPDPSPWP